MARDAKTGRHVATGQVEINVPLSKFAKMMGQARTIAVRSITTMGRSMVRIMSATWRRITAMVSRFTRTIRRLARLMTTAFLPLGAIGAGAAAGFGLYKVLSTFAEFEQRMARVQAVTGVTNRVFRSLWNEAKRLGATTAFSANQAAEAMGNFAVAGFKSHEIIKAMEPTLNLAAAGQLDMATASDIVAKTMKGMQLEADELTRAVDVMANAFTTANTDLPMLGEAFKQVGPIGTAAGASIEQITASIMAMSDAGIQGGAAGTALRNLFLRIQSQPREVAKVFEKLGIEIADSGGNMKSMSVIIDELNAKMASYTPVQRNAMLMAIAGTRASAALNTLMAEGGAALRDRESDLKREGTAAQIAARQMDTFKGSWTVLMSALEGAAIDLGETLAPSFRAIVVALQPFVTTLGQVMGKIEPIIFLMSQRWVGAISSLDDWMNRNMATFRTWGERVAEILTNLGNMWAQLKAKIESALGVTAGGAVSGLMNLVTTLVDAIATLTTDPQKTFGMLKDLIKAGLLLGAAALIKGLREAFSAYIAAWQAISITLATYWKEILSLAWEGLKKVFSWFIDLLVSVFKWAALAIAAAIETFIGFGTTFQDAAKSSLDLYENQKKKGPIGLGEIGEGYKAAFTNLQAGFSKAIEENVTGGVEADLRKRGSKAWKRVKKQWSEMQTEAASKRDPEVYMPEAVREAATGLGRLFAKAGEVVATDAPRLAADVAKGRKLRELLIPGAGKAGEEATKGSTKVTTSGITDYIRKLQEGANKVEEKIEDHTAKTAKHTGRDGPIAKGIKATGEATVAAINRLNLGFAP